MDILPYSYLEKPPADALRYEWWFGKRDDEGWREVKKVFENIGDSPLHTVYDCHTCRPHPDPNVKKYAYVKAWK